MLKKIKQTLLICAKMLGLFRLLGNSNWRQNRLLILGYHGVSLFDEHNWNDELFISPEQLRQRFEMIREKRCTVLPLSDAIERLYLGTLPKKTVSITFDDGLFDFRERALPILKEFGFHATLYVTTFYVEYNKPVFGVAADYLLWKGRTTKLDCNLLIGINEVCDLSDESDRRRAHFLICEYASQNDLSAEEKNNLLGKLCVALDIDFNEFCESRVMHLMTKAELAEVGRCGVDVELHTHRHRVPLDEELFEREIDDNRRVIEGLVAKRPNHFCYPSGVHNPRYFPWLECAKVISATTCEPGLAASCADKFMLPRIIDSPALSLIEFEGWLEGVSDFLPQRRQWTS